MVERVGLQLLQGLLHIHKHNHLDRVAVLICAGEFYGLEIFMHGCVQGDFGIALLRFNGAFCFRENVEFGMVRKCANIVEVVTATSRAPFSWLQSDVRGRAGASARQEAGDPALTMVSKRRYIHTRYKAV